MSSYSDLLFGPSLRLLSRLRAFQHHSVTLIFSCFPQVDVGNFLRFISCVENPCHPFINVEVVAHVTIPELRSSELPELAPSSDFSFPRLSESHTPNPASSSALRHFSGVAAPPGTITGTGCVCFKAMNESNSWKLLMQLEDILESDPLIDEIGFIHPSQFDALNEEGGSTSLSCESVPQSADKTTNISSEVFWSREHKLGISTTTLLPLYKAVKDAFMESLRQYRLHTGLTKDKDESAEVNTSKCPSSSLTILENEVMKHSRAILLFSCDFGTAWNFRKLLVSGRKEYSMFMEELLLSDLVLSYSPKSERAWSHRRWVIKMIAGKCFNLEEIVDRESEFVKKLAERSKMNYRAWNHRCWLVAYMSVGQMFGELNKSQEWAGLHVADNSSFHYRACLMLRILEAFLNKDQNGYSGEELDVMWKEELDWVEKLIKLYVGREALWLHRRFLASCWVKHFASTSDIDKFIDDELRLFSSCATIIDCGFEDYQAQATYAATYIMWLKKQIMMEPLGVALDRKLQVSGLKSLLNKACPEKAFLWDLLPELCGFE